ncbi:MAG: glycosyltransferase family 2 protein [Candidatus Aminicenantes bacterium]|nr:glycosyltransferase family 2 protein [Candidatus Aminicenantes bacterium]
MTKKNLSKKVSVIIPLYNQEQYVAEAIESILNQTYKNLETLVVNDGSTDNPLPILEKYKDDIIVINRENKGLAGARNTGIEHSSGDYIQFLDADDFLQKDKIKLQLEFSVENQADISYCEIARYFNDSKKITPRNVGEITDIFPHYYNLWNLYPTPIHSLLIKKKIFGRFGLFPEDFKANEDRCLLSLIAAGGVAFKYFPFLGGFYRIHAESMNFDHIRMMESKIKYYKKLNRELGDGFILEKTGFPGHKMMCANLTHVYLQAISDGVKKNILKRVKKLYKKEGVKFDVTPIPSRFKRSSLPRKLLAAYFSRWFGK